MIPNAETEDREMSASERGLLYLSQVETAWRDEADRRGTAGFIAGLGLGVVVGMTIAGLISLI